MRGFTSVSGKGFLFASLSVILLAGGASAQVVLPPEEGPGRVAIFQFGAGIAMPMASFAAAENPLVMGSGLDVAVFGDGFASSGTQLSFRVCVPLTRRIDAVADLILPSFKMKTTEFREQSEMYISHARYYGKLLSIGGRWFPLERSWGKGFLIGSAGMYQLINDRYLGGIQIVERGAFKTGGSIGAGVEFDRGVLPIDLIVRFHRYTDYGHFVQGDIAWMELAMHLSFPLHEAR